MIADPESFIVPSEFVEALLRHRAEPRIPVGFGTELDDLVELLRSDPTLAPATDESEELEDVEGIEGTDVGLAERFVADYGDRFRYVPGDRISTGTWFRWDGNRWEQVGEGKVDPYIEKMGRSLLREAAQPGLGEEARKELMRRAKRALTTAGINAIRARIAVRPEVEATLDEFDTHRHLLSVANGVVHLTTGELLSADPALMLSRGANVAYKPEATCPVWDKTLREVFDGNETIVEWFEKCLGYTITGETREHVFFVMYGPTSRNGKSLIMEAVKNVLSARLVVSSNTATFLRSYRSEANKPRGDIVDWRGARMIQTSELVEGARLDEELIKAMSGADTLTFRRLHHENEEFLNTGTLWIRTNQLPDLDPDSAAIWNRVRLFEFPVSFQGREDTTLPDKLADEAEGILARLVWRAVEFYKAGRLVEPAEAREARETWRKESDLLSDILERRFINDPNADTPVADVNKAIDDEYELAGETKLTPTSRTNRLQKKGYKDTTARIGGVKPTRVWRGLRLRAAEDA